MWLPIIRDTPFGLKKRTSLAEFNGKIPQRLTVVCRKYSNWFRKFGVVGVVFKLLYVQPSCFFQLRLQPFNDLKQFKLQLWKLTYAKMLPHLQLHTPSQKAISSTELVLKKQPRDYNALVSWAVGLAHLFFCQELLHKFTIDEKSSPKPWTKAGRFDGYWNIRRFEGIGYGFLTCSLKRNHFKRTFYLPAIIFQGLSYLFHFSREYQNEIMKDEAFSILNK